jgi:hypothetical protein
MSDNTSKSPFSRLDTDLMRSTKPAQQEQQRTPEQANARTPEPVNSSSPVRPNGKRITSRESFDIYEDQMASLREISYQEKREGKLGSMSAMAREAFDDFLKKRAFKIKL